MSHYTLQGNLFNSICNTLYNSEPYTLIVRTTPFLTIRSYNLIEHSKKDNGKATNIILKMSQYHNPQ